jgi:hypothetical protein
LLLFAQHDVLRGGCLTAAAAAAAACSMPPLPQTLLDHSKTLNLNLPIYVVARHEYRK